MLVPENLSVSPKSPGFHHCLAKLRRMPGKRKITGSDAAGFQSVSLESGCSLLFGHRPIAPVPRRIQSMDRFAEIKELTSGDRLRLQVIDTNLTPSVIQPR